MLQHASWYPHFNACNTDSTRRLREVTTSKGQVRYRGTIDGRDASFVEPSVDVRAMLEAVRVERKLICGRIGMFALHGNASLRLPSYALSSSPGKYFKPPICSTT